MAEGPLATPAGGTTDGGFAPPSGVPFTLPPPPGVAGPAPTMAWAIPVPAAGPTQEQLAVLARASRRNGWAVASVTLALLALWPIGLVFGSLAMRAVHRGEATNTGMARVGFIFNAFGTLAMFVVAMLSIGPAGTRTDVEDLAIGDCVSRPEDLASQQVDKVYVVSCDGEHWGQLYAEFGIEPGDYPGPEGIAREGAGVCDSQVAWWAVNPTYWADAHYWVVGPTPSAWEDKDRTVRCFVTDADGSVSGDWVVAN